MSKTITNNGYKVTASDQIIKEIQFPYNNGVINWHNFNENDMYFDNDGIRHDIKVNHAEKTVMFID